MSTWSLEHIPAAGGASTFGSLKVWGIESFAWQRVNWGVDTLTVSVCGSAPAFSSAIWSYLDKIILWRDGVRFAQAWCTFSQANVQPHQTRTYTLQGPGWFLTQYAPSYDTYITIYTAGAYMALALGNAVAAGAPIAYASSVAAAIDVECPEVRTSSTILELLQRACRYAPLSAGWWDYSGETPVFHAARRGDLTALDLERSSYVSEPFSLAPRYDLQLKSVRLQFGWSGSTSYYYDTAGTDVELQGPNRLRVALSFSTPEAALKAAGAGIAAKLMADLGPLCWTGTIPLHDGASRIPDIRPGIAVNLTGTGCREEWATMAAVVQQVTYAHQLGTDTASVELGVPEHLGPQDYLEFASLAAQSSASAAGEDDIYQDPASAVPGSLDDLNGTNEQIGTPGGSIAVQSRGGTWTLCGYVPYDGIEDSPPTRYRTETPAGTVVRRDYDWMHTTLLATRTDTPIGPRSWDGCTAPTASLWQRVQTAGGYCEAGTSGIDEPPSTAAPVLVAHLVRTCTNTCGAIGNGYGCCGNALGNCGIEYCGNATRTLSDPDTPEAAWQRLLSTSPAWTTSPNTAIRTVPATGITGIRRELRYRTEHTTGTGPGAVTSPTLTGLSRWTRYRLAVHLQRRSVDETGSATSDWVDAETVHSPAWVTDIDGVGGIDWQVIEPDTGYETKVATTEVELY